MAIELSVYTNPNFSLADNSRAWAKRQGDGSWLLQVNFDVQNSGRRNVAVTNQTVRFKDSGQVVDTWTKALADGNVAGHEIRSWVTNLSFPAASIANNLFSTKQHLELEVEVSTASGEKASMSILAQPLLRFGVNIITCGPFLDKELADLRTALVNTNSIYQAKGVEVCPVAYVDLADILPPGEMADTYSRLDSAEDRDALLAMSGGDNTNVDVFVVQELGAGFRGEWGRTTGQSGSIPGPTDHSTGVWVYKLPDEHGGLMCDKLGQLIAHEVGHYLGLGHSGEQIDLMNSFSNFAARRLTDAEYTTISEHGWMFVA